MNIYPHIMPRTKYVMSLDSLDLGLLPIDYQSRLNNDSLWPISGLNGHTNDYFKFEIKPKTKNSLEPSSINEESNADVMSHQDATTCYICDVPVPIAYLSDHEDSVKHRTFVKIADVALKRAREHMMRKQDRRNVRKPDATYYCGPCVDVVRAADRTVHEKSKPHKRCVSIDRLLGELAAIYVDDDRDTGHDSVADVEGVAVADDNISDVKTQNADSVNDQFVISDIQTRMDDHDQRIADRDKAYEIEEYIKLIDQYDVEKLNTLTAVGGNIKIETQDGFEVVVCEDNFHGFERIAEDLMKCKLCKMIVLNESDHKMSVPHIRKIVKPFADKNCVRNLDNSWSHCVICNEVIDNTGSHVLRKKSHAKLLESSLAVGDDDSDATDSPATSHYCPACNITIHMNDVASHERGYRHVASVQAVQHAGNGVDDGMDRHGMEVNLFVDTNEHYCQPCNIVLHVNSVTSHMKGARHAMNIKSPVHFNMKRADDGDGLVCRACKVGVADDVDDVRAHVQTAEHEDNARVLLSANSIVKRQNSFFCELCNEVVMRRNQFYHIEKYNHEVKLAAFNEAKAGVTKGDTKNGNGDDNTYLCDVCHVLIPNNATAIKVHKDGDVHKANLPSGPATAAVQADRKRADADENSYVCSVCNVKVPNSVNNINIHNNGDRHKRNVAEYNAKLAAAAGEAARSNVNAQATSNIPYGMAATSNENQLLCRVCLSRVPNNEGNISEHVLGNKHINNFKVLLDANSIVMCGDKFRCDACKIIIKDENLLEHVMEQKHTASQKSSEQEINTLNGDQDIVGKTEEVNKKEDKDSGAKVNIIESVDILYPMYKHHFLKNDDDSTTLKCQVCDVPVANTPMDALNHTAEAGHKDGFKTLMSQHLMFETDSGAFFCGVCKCAVPGRGEFHHVFGGRHKDARLKVTLNTETCGDCQLATVGCVVVDHVTSPRHIDTLKTNQNVFHYCNACGGLVTRSVEKMEQHRKYCLLMKKHRLVLKDKVCYCSICDQHFIRQLIDEHVESSHHLLLFSMFKH